jgi:hypothetical protein
MTSAVTSDAQGRFQFDEVPAGAYFILYDSGSSDFDAGLQRWGGQTLGLGDGDWLLNEGYVVPDANGNINFCIPAGTPIFGFDLRRYVVSVLLFADSPFVVAHKLDLDNGTPEFVIVDVTEGQTSQVEFKAAYCGD